ncbi:MAG: osmotically inducible protein OsmC [Chitinophagaceae bacterium]|nr:MAG: osmotically inducible protein OsmC [Chitinophagaceae bacterium]
MALIKARLADNAFGMDIMDEDNHTLRIDIPADQGGNGKGFRPMQTLLGALCGCSAVDVISILKKQKQELTNLEIEADGQREAGKEPSLWKTVHVVFRLSGKIDPSKGFRAVDLSIDKYCSVAETLRLAGATIEFTVHVNGEEVNG